MSAAGQLGGHADPAPTFLDPSGTSSYPTQARLDGSNAARENGRRADCATSQQAVDVAAQVVDALRSIANDERQRIFAERFAELLPGRGQPPELPPHGYPRPPGEVSLRSNAWKTIRREANAARTKWSRRADSIESCGTVAVVIRCQQCGHVWSMPDPCASRFCPKCVRLVRSRNIGKIQDIVATQHGRRRFLTLTIRSSQDLRSMLELLQRSLVRLRARRWWKDRVRAGVCAMEVTYSEGVGWHAHAHLLLWGRFLPRARLISEWQAATGCRCPRTSRLDDDDQPVLCCHSTFRDENGEFVRADSARSTCTGCPVEPTGVDIREARDADIAELCKYIGKDLGSGGGFLLDLDLTKEFLLVMWGRRMWSTFGAAFGVHRPDADCGSLTCEDCGSEDVEVLDRTTAPRPACPTQGTSGGAAAGVAC